MKTFVAIDFETANPKRVSACSVGGCVIQGSEITDSFSTLIKPPSEYGNFAPMNVRIHGITPDKVESAPTFEDLFPRFQARVKGRTVISYSKFDLSVINSLLDYYGHDSDFSYIDVCTLAKERIPGLANYKLQTVVKHLGLGEFNHHDAAEDANMCAKVFLALRRMEETSDDNVFKAKKESFADVFNLFASTIAEDGVVDYKEAVQLACFLEVLPRHDAVARLLQTVSMSLEDGEISDAESEILIAQLGMASNLFLGKKFVECQTCGGPLMDDATGVCPWCLSAGVSLPDDAEEHLDDIANSVR